MDENSAKHLHMAVALCFEISDKPEWGLGVTHHNGNKIYARYGASGRGAIPSRRVRRIKNSTVFRLNSEVKLTVTGTWEATASDQFLFLSSLSCDQLPASGCPGYGWKYWKKL